LLWRWATGGRNHGSIDGDTAVQGIGSYSRSFGRGDAKIVIDAVNCAAIDSDRSRTEHAVEDIKVKVQDFSQY
jgi:hypothetical protein